MGLGTALVIVFIVLAVTGTVAGFIVDRSFRSSGAEEPAIDVSKMKLVSREEFETPNGTGIKEVYREGGRVVIVTATPPDE